MKRSQYIISGVAAIIVLVAIIAVSNHNAAVRREAKKLPVEFVHAQAPSNPNLTRSQKLIFENRVGTSSTPATYASRMVMITSSAVSVDVVSVGDSCTPDNAVIKMYIGDKVTFTNTAKQQQTLIFGTKSFALRAGESKDLTTSDMTFSWLQSGSVAVKSYRCQSATSTAGYVVATGR